MSPTTYLLGLALSLSVGLAALFIGLWIGERGRRKDAQRRSENLPVVPPRKAQVIQEGESTVPQSTEAELEPPESFIRDTMRETKCTREEAEEEWQRLLRKVHSDQGSSWEPNL